jgi:hypothetical protein
LVALACAAALAGCETVPTLASNSPTIGSAVGQVAGTAVGQQYGHSDVGRSVGSQLGGVAGQVAKHTLPPGAAPSVPAAATASPAPAAPPAPERSPRKFCPVGGEHYPEGFAFCPIHGAQLKDRTPYP